MAAIYHRAFIYHHVFSPSLLLFRFIFLTMLTPRKNSRACLLIVRLSRHLFIIMKLAKRKKLIIYVRRKRPVPVVINAHHSEHDFRKDKSTSFDLSKIAVLSIATC